MASRLILFRSTATARWFSTVTAAATATATATGVTQDKTKTSLFHKILELKIRPDSDINIRETLDEWANQGKPIKRNDIVSQINFFRTRKNFNVALQLSEWLESSKIDMNNTDRAIRIDLLGKTKDIHSAEMYFNSLEESAKTTKTYGSLLSLYCKDKSLDKALELFAKMKELDFTSTLNYNNVIALYMNTGQPEQVPLLMQEMEQKNLKADIVTYNMLINSYASQKDVNAVEKVLDEMETKDIKCDWFTYGNLATIYINAENPHKALDAIQKMEKLENIRDREYFHTLITLYKQLSDLSGVDRTWKALKSVFPFPSNTSYLILLLALSKLGDVESLEKCFREWESKCSLYDVRVTNVVLESYLNRNMIEEANALYESMVTRGSEPNLRTMESLSNYHIKNYQIDSALKYLEMGASKVNREPDKWFPNDETIQMFLKYFEEKNDSNGALKFYNIMKKIDRLDSSVCASLLSSKVAAAAHEEMEVHS